MTYKTHIKTNKLFQSIKQTSLAERLQKIEQIYNKLETKQQKFCDDFNIRCIEGCGCCCEHFTPDITRTEAEFLAYGLIINKMEDDVLKTINENNEIKDVCPLYRKNDNHHCSIYKFRPLVCRLFGASASENKNGKPCFTHCKYNVNGKSLSSEELLTNKKALVIMSKYALSLEEIDCSNVDREILVKVLPKAIDKIKYLLELENKNSD